MYNIIESKYRGVFLICIIGILLFLFINNIEVKTHPPSLVSDTLATDNKNSSQASLTPFLLNSAPKGGGLPLQKKRCNKGADNASEQADSGKQLFTPMSGTGYINPDANNKNLFDLEKELVNAINNFNTSYYNFIRCSSGGSVNCGNNSSVDDVNIKSQEVIRMATALQSAYTSANIQTNDTTFESNHQEIIDKSKSIDELRHNLDIKMNTIIKNRNPPNELTQQYDSTVYTGIMWSVLATSVLFYVFTEM